MIVIAGTGLAGYTLAREFRKMNSETPLIMVTADDGASYSKPMLSNALDKGKTPESLVMADAAKMAEQLAAQIRVNTRIEKIQPETNTVVLDTGESIQYEKLVLAMGADPFRIPMEGDAVDQVLSVNDLADYARFRGQLDATKQVVIIGGGLIGCEFANDLRSAGHEVTVFDPQPTPIRQLLPEAAGRYLQKSLEAIGVNFRFGETIKAISAGGGSAFTLSLSNGDTMQADIVLSAVGLRPRIQLAREAGLKTGRGIMVDRFLRTTNPDIFAIGDCAEVDGKLLPYVMPIMQCARALAKTLDGQATQVSYPAMPVVIKTPACPVVVSPPPADAEGEWQISETSAGVNAQFRDVTGRLLGYVLVGEDVNQKQALTKELPAIMP